ATRRLAGEAGAATTESALRSALGASFAGAWFEPGSSRLAVATTDAARAATIRAAGARPRIVAHSVAALDAVMASLDSRSGSVPDSVTGWYLDPATNSVVVSATDPAAAQAFAAGAGPVRVEQVALAPRPLADLVGGEAIYHQDGGRCSVGFNTTSGPDRFVITAGHCTDLGGTWSGFDRNPIGPVAASSFPGDDFGLIRVDSPKWTQTGQVAGRGTRLTVAGSSEAAVGSSVCRSGSTTGYRCGTIEATDQTVNYGGGDVVSGLSRTTACAEPGDSGGPYITGSQAQGMLSGGSGNCLLPLNQVTFFQPVNEVLASYGLDLVTG
ncbi:MAG: S1 family peptidase, partial [Pseudonocardiaceae bacterium]